MPSLASGANVTLALSGYDSVTVSTHGVVLVEAVTGLGIASGIIAEHSGVRTFGMFPVAGSLKLTAIGRAAEYEIADGAAPVAPGGGGGAAIDTLPTRTAINSASVDTLAVVVDGVASQITMSNFVAGLGVADTGLPEAAALNGADILPITQSGVVVRTTLAALASFIGGGLPAAPGAVTSLATGTITETTAALTWVNATGATSWTVKQRPAGSGSYVDSTLSVAATATGATISGLTTATAYDFQVFAANAGGTGPAATLLNVSTAGSGAPAAVTALAAGTKTDTTVALTWANGSGATGWTVKQRPAGSGSYTASTLSVAASATGATVSGLTASTAYDFEVTPTNGSGSGPATTLLNITTNAATVNYTYSAYSGNTFSSTFDGTTASTVQGTLKGYYRAKWATNDYWNVSPDAASCRGGWGTSSTVPPADITAAQNSAGASSINGMMPLTKTVGLTFNIGSYLWIPSGSGTSTWYFWIKGVNGTATCLTPSGVTVTGV